MIESILLVSSALGGLIALTLLCQIRSNRPENFFLGLVVFALTLELLFSWGAYSGYNNRPGAVPYWNLMNYLILPPALWIFVRYKTDDNFHFQKVHLLLFFPAIVAYAIEFWAHGQEIKLVDSRLWLWFSDYLPMLATIYILGIFWAKYFKFKRQMSLKSAKMSMKLMR